MGMPRPTIRDMHGAGEQCEFVPIYRIDGRHEIVGRHEGLACLTGFA
jgi:hypothetical protein